MKNRKEKKKKHGVYIINLFASDDTHSCFDHVLNIPQTK